MYENETRAQFLQRAWAKARDAMMEVSDSSPRYTVVTRGHGEGFVVEASERPESRQTDK